MLCKMIDHEIIIIKQGDHFFIFVYFLKEYLFHCFKLFFLLRLYAQNSTYKVKMLKENILLLYKNAVR
jgi:hypothetical protein